MYGVFGGETSELNLADQKWIICKLEEIQKIHDHPNPIKCSDFPFNKVTCNECESILIECTVNCKTESECISECNRAYTSCIQNCAHR